MALPIDRGQLRRVYLYWPVFLEWQRRQARQHFVDDERVAPGADVAPSVLESEELALLREIELPLGDLDLGSVAVPRYELVAGTGTQFEFRVSVLADEGGVAVLAFIRQGEGGQQAWREMLRVALSDAWYVEVAAERLNTALAQHGVDLTFNAARLWSILHGGVVLDWRDVEVDGLLESGSENDNVPVVAEKTTGAKSGAKGDAKSGKRKGKVVIGW